MLEEYLEKIFHTAKKGDAREESFYTTLESLLYGYAADAKLKKVDITMLPKKTEAGNPDFRVWDGHQHIVGYIEAKRPDQKLDDIQSSEQLKRYRGTFPNLILTNFLEFRLYRNGDLVDAVQIGRPVLIHDLRVMPPVENREGLLKLLEKFFAFSLPKSYTAKSLAIELAKRTRFLKEQVLIEELAQEAEAGSSDLGAFYEAFKTFLIAGLTMEDFADLYAQTVTYGLFAARSRAENGFTRKTAFDNIPPTIGILRDVFRFVSFGDMPKQMESIVDDIAEVLAVADVNKILRNYYEEGKGRDPIVHFYETFLAEYDPKMREKRGVYYTPEPVVSYIVRSLHQILKSYFGKEDGFANASVRVLDPAAGTLTFLAEAAKVAAEEFEKKYGEGAKKDLIHDHILNDFYAFELMMAPYAIGHLKMAFLLAELGYVLKPDERFKLYLTNTLDMEELEKSKLPGMSSLAEESHLAATVKNETPILAILGNPPYSGHSSNKGDWIQARIQDYFQVDGKPLGEKNPKWLQDDYVKFIRFAQWKIDQAGEGVLGFITNHSYLDNPTFRGMRQSLMNSFDEMYILDLHGNSLKKEKCPDGAPDENVFDIRQGVAIALFIKKPGLKKKVAHAELWGLREQKYNWLLENDLSCTKWRTLTPHSDAYLLVPRDEDLLAGYEEFPRITEIFPVNSVGIVTARDKFVVDFDKSELERRIGIFRDKSLPDEVVREAFGLKDNRDWKMNLKRKAIIDDPGWREKISPCLYRPFDVRWLFYHRDAIDFGRQEVMRHMLAENLALVSCRQLAVSGFSHALCSTNIVDDCLVSNRTKERGYVFPLYLYNDSGKPRPKPRSFAPNLMIFEPPSDYPAKRPNLSGMVVEKLTINYGHQPSPEEVYYYIYGILYSPAYRSKYAEFLKTDFPRIPFSSDVEVFRSIGSLGQRLAELHLVKSKELSSPTAKFRGSGDNLVEKPLYGVGDRIYINEAQYFDGVGEDEWKYQIGGYQVLEKWLKDRKGRRLSAEDIKHYCRVATAISKTIKIQEELDKTYPLVEKATIDFK